jgi:TolB protein
MPAFADFSFADPSFANKETNMRYLLAGIGFTLYTLTACVDQPPVSQAIASIQWQTPQLYAAGQVSTPAAEVRLAISPDGRHEVWGVIDQRGQGWDLFERFQRADGWSTPTPVSFNSSSNDFDPAFSADGQTLFFFSNRAGSIGGDDIWSVQWQGEQWGTATRLDSHINTAANEWAPTPLRNGCLLFASDGHGGAGGMDLFQSCPRAEHWQTASALTAFNTAAHEYDAAVLGDDRSMVFTRSDNPNEGGTLWLAQPQADQYRLTVLPASVNSSSGWNLGPSTTTAYPGKLFITSYRQEQHVGRLDIFVVDYQLTP